MNTVTETPKKKPRRFVMSLIDDDEKNLSTIVDHHRTKAGYDVKIAEIVRRKWKEDAAAIRRKASK